MVQILLAVVAIIVDFLIAGGSPLSLASWWTQRGARQLKELHYMLGGCINTNITIILLLPDILFLN